MSRRVTSRFVLQGDNQLTSAFAKARTQLNNLGRQAALFGTAMAAGIAVAVRAQAGQIDELAKTADALGVTTENLQALQQVAKLTGASTSQLEKAMERMQRSLGEAARRGGNAAKALADIGLSMDDVLGMSADKQLEVVSKALANVGDAAVRASIENDIFGRGALQMRKMMNQLAKEGLDPVRSEIEALGGAISRTQAAGVERMNDAMERASVVSKGLSQQYTAALAPAIAAIAEQFIAASKETGGFQTQAIAAAEATVKGFASVADAVAGVERVFQVWGRSLAVAFATMELGALQFANSIINGPGAAMDFLIRQANRIPGIDVDFEFGPAAPQIQERMDRAAGIVREGVGDIHEILMKPLPGAELIANFKRVRDEIANSAPGEAGVNFDLDEAGDSIEAGLTDAQRRAQAIFQSTRTDVERYAEQLNEAFGLFREGLIDEETFRRFVDQIEEAFEVMEETADDAFSQMSVYAEQAARNMQDHLADFLFDPFADGLKGMLRGFIDTLRRMAAQAAASQIFDAIPGGGIGGFLKGIFGGPRADGGPVSSSKTYLVGERGPELFTPSTSGQIIPNHAMGGGNVTVNIDARQSDDPARLLALAPVIANQVEQSISLKMRRGYL